HKAKGLESPVVILANPSSNPQHEPDFHARRLSGEALGYLSVWRRKNEYQSETLAAPQGWDAYRDEEARYLEAERVRLLYVAATRARNLLVVSQCPSRGSKNPWSPLEPYLEGMAPLEVFPAGVTASGRGSRDGPPLACGAGDPGFAAACRRIEESLEGIKRPSYRHDSVTGVTGRGAYPGGAGGGRGAAWGSLVHRMLALAASWDGEPAGLIDDLAAREGLDTEEKGELARVLRAVTASPFWRRVVEADERCVEAPFGTFDRDVYLTGAMDLVFREGSGWVVADYKSDDVESAEHLRKLVDYYAPQVREYARRWAAVTREPVTECGIFFTTVCEWRRA
ncbi:MAG: PD-(D/E)XK nuclease family protein, partial [Bacillota bacterium]